MVTISAIIGMLLRQGSGLVLVWSCLYWLLHVLGYSACCNSICMTCCTSGGTESAGFSGLTGGKTGGFKDLTGSKTGNMEDIGLGAKTGNPDA